MYDDEKERRERRAKQTDFENFLEDNKSETLWLATPSGIFQGEVSLQSETIVTLRNAFCFSQKSKLSVGEATIIILSINAWGTSNLAYQNTD
jgi:hypothetical protein